MTGIDRLVLWAGIFGLSFVICRFWIPMRVKLVIRQCGRRSKVLVNGYTAIFTLPKGIKFRGIPGETIEVPNLFIITLFIVACVFAVKWLP